MLLLPKKTIKILQYNFLNSEINLWNTNHTHKNQGKEKKAKKTNELYLDSDKALVGSSRQLKLDNTNALPLHLSSIYIASRSHT